MNVSRTQVSDRKAGGRAATAATWACIVSSCAGGAHGPTAVSPDRACSDADIGHRYSEWLRATGLSEVISVDGSAKPGALHLSVTDSYQKLRDAATELGVDLDLS